MKKIYTLLGLGVIIMAGIVMLPDLISSSFARAESYPISQKNRKTAALNAAVKNKAQKKYQTAIAKNKIDENHLNSFIDQRLSLLISQGLLKGAKGDKGDKGEKGETAVSAASYAPTVMASWPDSGTVIGATLLSAAALTAGDSKFSGDMEVEGDVKFFGQTRMATSSADSLQVGSLASDSGAYLSAGGAWINASSRSSKENFASTSPEEILNKIDSLPIYSWNYKKESASIMHIGPLAEDFHEAFGLGGKNGKETISTIDPAGVALLGIQTLNQKLKTILDIFWLVDGLKKLGVKIVNGIIKAKQFAAELVQTKELEVGSSEHPTGITIYDRIDGGPMCIFSENKTLKLEGGKCGSINTALVEAPKVNEANSQTDFLPEAEQKIENSERRDDLPETQTAEEQGEPSISEPDTKDAP